MLMEGIEQNNFKKGAKQKIKVSMCQSSKLETNIIKGKPKI